MKFKRNCPNCNHTIEYKTKSQYNDVIKYNRKCKNCANKLNARKHMKNHIKYSKICIKCDIITIFSAYNNYKNSKKIESYMCKSCALSITHTKKVISAEHKLILSNMMKEGWRVGKYDKAIELSKERWSGKNNPMYNSKRFGKKNPFYGKSHTSITIEKMKNKIFSKKTKDKMSISAKIRVNLNGMNYVNYNPFSIPLLEQKAKELGIIDLQHAENGGEYKIKIDNKYYFVDGYSKEKNVVIEYYEKHHRNNTKKDLQRQKEISDLLKCKFIIIRE